jgi:NAD(P)-dependent dehydrogenase (short-subunit alcohol dehydrogenase family)
MAAGAIYPDLRDKVVLVTGGGSGIGEAIVRRFAGQGSRTALIDIQADASRALAGELAASGATVHFEHADLTDITALRAAIGRVRERFGPVEILVNNAAHDERHATLEVTPEYWDERIAVNLKHQFFAAKNVAVDMKAAGGGSIINFGSVSWKLKQGGMPVYTTSKSAVQGLTRSLARDLGPHHIRVNTLVPGWVMTDKQIRLWLDEQGKQDIARGQCINQPLLPAHIASMALFLAADDSAMCTAQDFIVDGGWV